MRRCPAAAPVTSLSSLLALALLLAALTPQPAAAYPTYFFTPAFNGRPSGYAAACESQPERALVGSPHGTPTADRCVTHTGRSKARLTVEPMPRP